MDRKAWFVVILCAFGIVWSFNDMQKKSALAAEAAKQATSIEATVTPTMGKAADPKPPTAPEAPAEILTLRSDRADFEFSTRTGGLQSVVTKTLSGQEGEHLVLNQFGSMAIGALALPPVLSATGVPVRAPDGRTYRITEKDDNHVVMEATDSSGLVVKKTFALLGSEGKDPNLLSLSVRFENKGKAPVEVKGLSLYVGGMGKIRPSDMEPPNFFWNDNGDADKLGVNAFQGGWFSSERKEITESAKALRWTGVMDRYNAVIVSPAKDNPAVVWTQPGHFERDGKTESSISGGLVLDDMTLKPGASEELSFQIYAGAKEYRRLVDLGDDRRKVMFYGWFSLISRLMINLMSFFQNMTHSWGWAIVLMTIAIRLCLYPLMAGSQKSMKKMAGMQDEMKALREKYKDDPRRQQMETMALYKKHGVNPVAGCLPVFIQIPVFFGFFAVINHAAELRGEPFLWWVKDLSLPDTVAHLGGFAINPLPIVMAVTSFLQMRSMPQTGDATMRRVMMFMPLMFLFFCYNYASGLALYWTVGNIFTIVQTWLTKKYSKDTPATPGVVEVNARTLSASAGKRPEARPGGGRARKKR